MTTVPGVALAAIATLSLGAVLGPEAPLIALGGGLAAGAIRMLKRDTPPTALAVVAAAGSFAAISELLGSPLLGAFLLMEASGLAGPMLGVVLVPGLLAAGVGSLIFTGLDNWTGLGTYSLSLHQVPPPTGRHSPRSAGRSSPASRPRSSARPSAAPAGTCRSTSSGAGCSSPW